MNKFLGCALAGALLATAFGSTSALAQDWKERTDIDIWTRLQYIGEESNDLGTNNEDYEDSFSQQLQLMVETEFTPDVIGYFHGRAINIDGDTGFDDDTGEAVPLNQSFLELRELYMRFEDVLGIDPLYLQVGRQRLREPRAIWWNSDQDLAKVGVQSSLFSAFVAAGEDTNSYRTTTDNDYEEDDEDRFRILGEVAWQYQYNHFLEFRTLYEHDHSGLEPVGSRIRQDNRDDEDQEVIWAGVRSAGTWRDAVQGVKNIKYQADLIGLYGEEELLDSTAGGNFRTVTGSRSRDVRAWAFDGTLIVDPYDKKGPVFNLGYAFATGEDDPNGSGTDNEFRQTDLDGNFSRLGLERNLQRNYGEVLRPELSNLHIASAGVAYPFSDYMDVNATYYHYRLDEDATSHRSSNISAARSGNDKDVGQALDLALYVDVDDEFSLDIPYTRDLDFRLIVGSFFPGDAYEPSGTNEAFRIFSEFKFSF